jgi:hypothetical protein
MVAQKDVAIPGVPGSRGDSFGSRKGLRRRQKDGESALWEVGDLGCGGPGAQWLSL